MHSTKTGGRISRIAFHSFAFIPVFVFSFAFIYACLAFMLAIPLSIYSSLRDTSQPLVTSYYLALFAVVPLGLIASILTPTIAMAIHEFVSRPKVEGSSATADR